MVNTDSTMGVTRRPSDADQPRARRVVYRVAAVLVALWLIALNVFGLLELVLMWFPTDTLAEMFGEEGSFIEAHRVHFMNIGIVSWAVVLSIVVQLRKPHRRLAPMLFLIVFGISAMVLFGLSGTLDEWLVEEVAMVAAPIAAVALLHPARDRFVERSEFDRGMAALVAAAAIPWAVYVFDNAWAQYTAGVADPHAEAEHWALAALMGIVVIATALLGATDHPGWRLTAWIAAAGSMIFGVHSLVFPGPASALPPIWAIAAVAWGVAFAATIIWRSRAAADVPTSFDPAAAG